MESDHLIAYNCEDYDGYRWRNKWFPQKGTDGNQYMVQEMNKFSAYILEEQLGKGISDIPKLGAYYAAEPSEYTVVLMILSSIALYFGQGNGMQAIKKLKQRRLERRVNKK